LIAKLLFWILIFTIPSQNKGDVQLIVEMLIMLVINNIFSMTTMLRTLNNTIWSIDTDVTITMTSIFFYNSDAVETVDCFS